MAKFALACEGVTDQIVIENILCGFYQDYDDLDEEIQALQPPYDATTQKQQDGEFGGWEQLLNYLSEKRFRDDVLNSEYIIIQIDSDISEHPNFNITKQMESIEEYIERIRQRLVESIDLKTDFYTANKDKIIFAISVHSLECWLLPLYKSYNNEKITGCCTALQRESKKIKVAKNYPTYARLSQPFLKHKILMGCISKSSSLEIFTSSLPNLI